ncbi:CHAT domain-containing protein [Winogradskyella flava]|uniref:CHAT domain-containing protein n=1 Tax=Winogradskyella flava TaxID=1884876 RepID=A0A842IPX6_9FLAO|nr:CHAT domain-containing tetratricopeptide repeat protein [Winogradskyella flava]MBC2844745.1 CHAT domain-containing protein [Winogradskyella flava]
MKQFYNCCRLSMMFFILFNFHYGINSQNNISYSTKIIQNLIDVDSLDKAEKELKTQAEYYVNTKQYDSLSKLTYYFGRIAKLKGDDNFLDKANNALDRLKSFTKSKEALYNAYSDMASLTLENDMNKASYDYNKLAFEAAKKTSEDRLNKMSSRSYGLASTSYFMRKLDLAKKHGLETFKINQKNPKASATNVYNACNIIGVMLQNESKLDSALYYYDIGVKALKKTKGNLSERYYYPAVLSSNIAVIYLNQGKFNKSLKNQQEAIHNYKIFMDSSSNHPRLSNIRYNYLATINDMGSNYIKIGQIERSLQLFEHNYIKAKEYFPENSIQQIVFTNQYAQSKWVAQENEEALDLINESYVKLKKLPESYAGYMTYSLGTKANILENFGRIEEAYKAYNESDSLYEVVSPNTYSFDRLTKLREAATFYSRNNFVKEANITANRVLQAVQEAETTGNLEIIKTYNLFAEIKLNLEEYDKSIDWANKSLAIIKENRASINMDSIFWHELKIQPIFYKSKAQYHLTDTTNTEDISRIYKTLQEAIKEININASKYDSYLDKNEYLHKANGLQDFVMQVALKLYKLTNNQTYLDQLISMHESRIYNQIRSKLAVRDDIQFKNIPESVLEREKQLKKTLSEMRSETNFDKETAQNFILKNKEWNSFLDSLKLYYPKYYKLRHEILKQSLGKLQSNIIDRTTVVRYFFIDSELYAFVLDPKNSSLHRLNADNLLNQINLLSQGLSNSEKIKTTLFRLYNQLWKPLENRVKNEKVIIIPDQELFNLSFESLTSVKLNNLDELTESSLLAKYVISYNYSLYLLDKNIKTKTYSKDFIAFAPGFNRKMKENYKVAITDSINIDKTYLKLLPQPFTTDLAEEYSQLFNGTSFINEKASKQIFKSEAREHKIIHIGTHAESNNVSPELSRLIFAKDVVNEEDNSLYTFEIYNENLSSNLAILTACETGKPTFQSGEGMISLAHAFNYAGSESILTSLWKIDEQSSTKIIDNFYGHLKNGLPKDLALQKAKLDYLSTAEGRTLSPQYWAGLVLIGDTSPIDLDTSKSWVWWLIMGIVIMLLFLILIRNSKKLN